MVRNAISASLCVASIKEIQYLHTYVLYIYYVVRRQVHWAHRMALPCAWHSIAEQEVEPQTGVKKCTV